MTPPSGLRYGATTPLATTPGPTAHLLHATPQLILKRQILRALHRLHEARERTLLAREQFDSAPLHIDELIHEPRDAILVRAVATHHLGTQANANGALLLVERPPLRFHVAVHFPEPPHLIGGEAEPLLDDSGHPLAHALLECLTPRRPGIGHRALGHNARRRRDKRESEQHEQSRNAH
jgi:hypothetical protein